MSRKFALLFGGAFIFVPGIFALVGIVLAINQRHVIKTYQPIQAIVLSRHIATISDRHGDTYKPVVRYEYMVSGHRYTSQRVNIMQDSASYSWAERVVDRYPVGRKCKAWYDPQKPQEAVLDRTASFIPSGLMLFTLPFFAVGFGVLRSGLSRPQFNLHPESHSPSWFTLLPEANLHSRLRSWLILTLVVDGAFALILWNYFSIATPPYGWLVVIVTAVVCALAVVPLVLVWRTWRLGGLVQDGQLELGGESLATGTATNCRISQTYRRAVTIKKVTLTLQCRRIQKMGNTTNEDFPWKHEQVVGEAAQAAAGEELTWTTALTPPAGWPGSTAPNSGANPDYRYYLKLAVSFAGAPGYSEKFIVQLTSDASASLMPPVTAGFAPAGSSAGMP